MTDEAAQQLRKLIDHVQPVRIEELSDHTVPAPWRSRLMALAGAATAVALLAAGVVLIRSDDTARVDTGSPPGPPPAVLPPAGNDTANARRDAVAADETAWERYMPASIVDLQHERHPSGMAPVAMPPDMVGYVSLGVLNNPVPVRLKQELPIVVDDQGRAIGFWDVVVGPVTIDQYEDDLWDLDAVRATLPQNPSPDEIADLVDRLAPLADGEAALQQQHAEAFQQMMEQAAVTGLMPIG